MKPDWKVGHLDRVRAVKRYLERGIIACDAALDAARTEPVTDRDVERWFSDMLIIARRVNFESMRPPSTGEGP